MRNQQAILITAYKNFDNLIDICQCFDDQFEIYIHIDKKSIIPSCIISQLKQFDNVKLISQKYYIKWGGINHVKAILFLIEQSLQNQSIGYFHFISGQDFPIKSKEYFKKFAVDNSEYGFIEYSPIPREEWANGGLDRINYYNLYDLINGKKSRKWILRIVKLQKWLRIKRKIKKEFSNLYGGTAWWSFNRVQVEYINTFTNNNPYLLNRLKHTFGPGEIYIHSVLMNSSHKLKIHNNSLRFIDWRLRNNNHPANLDLSDYDTLTNTKALFARKFEKGVSDELKRAIINELLIR